MPVIKENGARRVCEAFDGNKDVSELVFFRQANGVAAHYEYAPFGGVTATNSATPVTSHDFIALNPLRFSSEFADDTLGLVYYNYRHYEPTMGRWLTRDPIGEIGSKNLYEFLRNSPIHFSDRFGLLSSEQIQKVLERLSYCKCQSSEHLKHTWDAAIEAVLQYEFGDKWQSKLSNHMKQVADRLDRVVQPFDSADELISVLHSLYPNGLPHELKMLEAIEMSELNNILSKLGMLQDAVKIASILNDNPRQLTVSEFSDFVSAVLGFAPGGFAQTVFKSLFRDLMKEIGDGVEKVRRQQDARAYEVFMTFECRDLLDSYRSIERGSLFERIQHALNANDRP